MSPNGQAQGNDTKIPNNVYTVILAFATGAVVVVAAYVLYVCYTQYGFPPS
jgi:hypothetical protein